MCSDIFLSLVLVGGAVTGCLSSFMSGTRADVLFLKRLKLFAEQGPEAHTAASCVRVNLFQRKQVVLCGGGACVCGFLLLSSWASCNIWKNVKMNNFFALNPNLS